MESWWNNKGKILSSKEGNEGTANEEARGEEKGRRQKKLKKL